MSLFDKQISPGTHGIFDLNGSGLLGNTPLGLVHITSASGITAREVWLWKTSSSVFPHDFALKWGAPESGGQPISPRSPGCFDYEEQALPANPSSATVEADGNTYRVYAVTLNDETTIRGYLQRRIADGQLIWFMFTDYVSDGRIDFSQGDALLFKRHTASVGTVSCHKAQCNRIASM
ncbi:MAG: hypothetical protein ACI8PZ_001966 [Myxococcota bacterium]|jgi:hypothetical protein